MTSRFVGKLRNNGKGELRIFFHYPRSIIFSLPQFKTMILCKFRGFRERSKNTNWQNGRNEGRKKWISNRLIGTSNLFLCITFLSLYRDQRQWEWLLTFQKGCHFTKIYYVLQSKEVAIITIDKDKFQYAQCIFDNFCYSNSLCGHFVQYYVTKFSFAIHLDFES